MDSESEAVFNLKLQIEQLQEKVEFLAGGTDGEQLAELLMEKEEEGRVKDRHIARLEHDVRDISAQFSSADKERSSLQALSTEQAASIEGLQDRVAGLVQERDGLEGDLKTARGQLEALEAERSGLEQLLGGTKEKLESTTSALAQRKSQVAQLQESIKANERIIEDLTQRKKDMAARTRSMKMELEQKLVDEAERYRVLEGQLAVCQGELSELKRLFQDKCRVVEEYQLKEKALNQDNGRLEVKLTTLADENRKLQHTILQLEHQRKDVESQNVSLGNRSAKYEEDIMCLQRELERQKVAKENDMAKISQQARLRDTAWRDKLQKERQDLHQVIREHEEQLAMFNEDSEARQEELREEIRLRDGQVDELTGEVNRLVERILDLEQHQKEMEEYKKNELDAERRWRTGVQSEMNDLKKELLEQRKAGAEIARIRQENETLKEKITRQEAYMRRKMMKDRAQGKDASFSAFLDTKPLEEEFNKVNQHPASTNTQAATQSPPSCVSRIFLREEKENFVYKNSSNAGTAVDRLFEKTLEKSGDLGRSSLRSATPPLRREGLAPVGRASTPLSARGAPAQPKLSSASKSAAALGSSTAAAAPRVKSVPLSASVMSRPSPGRSFSPSPRTWR